MAGPIDAMGRAARLPTKESRAKSGGAETRQPTIVALKDRFSTGRRRAKVLPNLIEPRAVRGAVSITQAETEKRAVKPNKEASPWQHEVLARFE